MTPRSRAGQRPALTLVSWQATNWSRAALVRAPVSPVAGLVLMVLADRHHHQRDALEYDPAELRAITGRTKRSVQLALAELRDAGLIDLDPVPGRPATITLRLSTGTLKLSTGAKPVSHPADGGAKPVSHPAKPVSHPCEASFAPLRSLFRTPGLQPSSDAAFSVSQEEQEDRNTGTPPGTPLRARGSDGSADLTWRERHNIEVLERWIHKEPQMEFQEQIAFASLLRWSAEVHDTRISPILVSEYWSELKAYPLTSVHAAFEQHRKERAKFPSIAELRRLIVGSAEDRALIAWGALLRLAGRYSSAELDDPIAVEALKRCGGWAHIGRLTERELPHVERKFMRIYTLLSNAPAEYEETRIVYDGRGTDSDSARIRLHPSPQHLIEGFGHADAR